MLLPFLAVAVVIVSHVSCTTVPYRDTARATSLMEAGRYQEALTEYTRAINLRPDYSTAYLGRGYVYQRLGDYKNALADYTKVIQLAPTDSEAHVVRGLLCDLMGNPEQAISDYTMAITIRPSNAAAHYHRGMDREKLGDLQGAIADLQAAAAMGHAESRSRLLAMGMEQPAWDGVG